jgi:hypothetical protein
MATWTANDVSKANAALTVEKNQLAALKKRLDAANKAQKALKKPSAKDKKATAKYNAALAASKALVIKLNASIAASNASITKAQNTIYTNTGQYDKLLQGANRDAYLAIQSLFKSYGLDTLAPKIYDYVKNGYSSDTISILLQDTAEYKNRFAGNEARKKAGLPVLSPAEYLSTEASYRQIMESAGLPVGFYDSPSDFNAWIGKNVSPSEIQTRVDLATQATVLSNPAYRQALNKMGIGDNELTAYFLDQNKALPFIQKSAATAAVGAEAIKQGLSFDQSYAEQLATSGISADEAKQGYSTIASSLDTYRALGQIYGAEWNQRTAEQATFEGNATQLNKQNRLLSAERGAFAGSTGGSRTGLGQAGGSR